MSFPERISILGCGWVGLPLGEALVQAGVQVRGSTTRAERLPVLREAGIDPYQLTLDPDLLGDDVGRFFETDVLVLTVPPPRNVPSPTDTFLRQLQAVLREVRYAPVQWIVFLSSTSVYPAVNARVDEQEPAPPDSKRGRRMKAAEETVRTGTHADTTVLRLAGLYGYDRVPGRFLAGRTDVANGDAPVNLVHRDDVVGVVMEVLRQDARDEVFNVCSDEHPLRRIFYPTVAQRAGLTPPTFADDGHATYKIVDNRHVKDVLNYTFRHPDPMQPAP